MPVKVIKIDDQGRINLSMKAMQSGNQNKDSEDQGEKTDKPKFEKRPPKPRH